MCFVFDDYLSVNKLKKKSRRHEYCLKFRALHNPYAFIKIQDSHVYGGTDPMESPSFILPSHHHPPLTLWITGIVSVKM